MRLSLADDVTVHQIALALIRTPEGEFASDCVSSEAHIPLTGSA